MRIWEIARKPRLVLYRRDLLLTSVRIDVRKCGGEVIPVLKSIYEDRVTGFLTPIELILPTSHYTSIRVGDALREYPILVQDNDIGEAFYKLRMHRVVGAPVVDSLENMKLIGVVTYNDILNYLIKTGYKPLAETVSEVMTVDGLEKYIISWRDRVNKVWSRIVYHGLPGVVAVRSDSEWIPMGIVTYREFLNSNRWFLHRESEHGFASPAKVQRIMLRGVMVASYDMPIEAVAKVMAEQDIPLVPVIDKDGRVVGVVTYEDVVRAYLEGAKPGRVPVPVAKVLPVPVAREERVVFVSREKVLSQVLVSRVVEKPFYTGVVAKDILVKELPAITVNDTVEHARKEMLRRRIDYLLVVDEKGEIVGLVSKWNMLHAIGIRGALWRRRVKDRYFIDYIMTRNIPRVEVDTPLEDIALVMASSEAEVVVVVDENGELAGFITKDEVVKASRDFLKDLFVENLILPGRIACVNPFHSLHHVVSKMKTLYLDALTVYDGVVHGVVSANKLPFIAFEDTKTGVRSRRLIWVRKLVKGAARKGRYVKITPLLAIDVMTPYKRYLEPATPASKAVDEMVKARLNGLPVLSSERDIVSTITKNDILRELARRAKKIAEIKLKTRKQIETKRKQ